jgi:Holliday junction resolvase RusA-like endonuclease
MTYRNKTIKQKVYLEYQNELRDEMMGQQWPFGSDLVTFFIVAGFSNKGADLDNVLKPLFDTYQGIFEEFNDNKVYHSELHKVIMPKGKEFLYVKISELTDEHIKESKKHAEKIHTNGVP